MNETLAFGLACFTSFFSLMNPIGLIPIYTTMTSELDESARRLTARKSISVALIVLLIFAFSGNILFDFFHISVDGFRVVGGIILFLMGQDMLQARLSKIKVKEESVKAYVEDISVTPLAVPLITGPGAISTAIVFKEDADTSGKTIAFLAAVFLVCLICYLAMLGAGKINKLLGPTVNNVIMRLMGLIVMVIAVEFFFAGLGPILQRIL